MPKVQAVVFDLDGTLVNTLADIADTMNHVLAAHGLPGHEVPAYRRFVGEGVARLVTQTLPPRALDAAEALQSAFRVRYADHMLDRSLPYPGIDELLATLAERQIPMAVLSNKPDDATRQIVSTLFRNVAFVEVVGQRADKPNKPDPTVAFELARAMGVAPTDCAFVGDSGIDMATAHAAGMVAVGVTWGFRERAELRVHGAAALLDRPEQFIALLG